MVNRVKNFFKRPKPQSCMFPCPRCDGESLHMHLGKNNWCVCKSCRIRWCGGYGLVSLPGWETSEMFLKNAEELLRFEPHNSDAKALFWDWNGVQYGVINCKDTIKPEFPPCNITRDDGEEKPPF